MILYRSSTLVMPEPVILLISYCPPLASTILHLLVSFCFITLSYFLIVLLRSSEIASEAGGMLEVWSAGIHNKSHCSQAIWAGVLVSGKVLPCIMTHSPRLKRCVMVGYIKKKKEAGTFY